MVFLGREISEQKDYGDKVADLIDEEVNKIIRSAHRVAKKVLTENKPQLIRIAQKLIAEETLEGEALNALFSEATLEPTPETTATPVPETVEATTKTKPRAKKAPATPETSPGLP
jgi:cell division protease FtsH